MLYMVISDQFLVKQSNMVGKNRANIVSSETIRGARVGIVISDQFGSEKSVPSRRSKLA